MNGETSPGRERPERPGPVAGEPPRQTPRQAPERFCPNCGAALLERRCKLLCPVPACGYFMSCSDFY